MAGPSEETLAAVLGWTATVCFALILAPQIVLNQMRRSCEGFSISLLLLWHIGAVAVFPLFMFEEEPLPLMLQGGLFTLASVVCEVQFYAFRSEQDEPPSKKQLWALGLASFGLSAGTILGLMALFEYVADTSHTTWLIEGFGSVVSSLCFALGFLPQISLMVATRSSEGFSVGVSLLDLTGSLLSIIVLILEAQGHKPDVGAVMPYAIIVAMQSLLLSLSLAVFPDPKRWQHTRGLIATVLNKCCRLPRLAARIRGDNKVDVSKPNDKDDHDPTALPSLDCTRHNSSALWDSHYDDEEEGGNGSGGDGAMYLSPSPASSPSSSAGSLSFSLSSSSDEEEGEGQEEEQGVPCPNRGFFVDVELGGKSAAVCDDMAMVAAPAPAAAFAPAFPQRGREQQQQQQQQPRRKVLSEEEEGFWRLEPPQ